MATGDGGVSWRPGSVVEFRRVAEQGRWPASGQAMPSWETGDHCDEAAFEVFDFLAGGWQGEIRFADGHKDDAVLNLDGLASRSEVLADRVLLYTDDADETLFAPDFYSRAIAGQKEGTAAFDP